MFGMSYDKPAKHMREYIDVITPLLNGEAVSYSGEQYKINSSLKISGASKVPLIIAARGPLMLKIAGTYADGTTLWVTGPKAITEYIVPTITAAASAVGKAAPCIVAALPIVVTNDVAAAKFKIVEDLKTYDMLPSYRAMLDREGAGGPEDVAIIGDAIMVKEGIAKLSDASVTDFNTAIMLVEEGSLEATLNVLQSELS
jgi:F420-dependent oxidoreductase-like protein|tara:strand:+ start:904 stop:1503 length:600 start_codon:yes stop_codon:yes gene_type:complete